MKLGGGGGGDDQIFWISCDFSVYLSLFDLNETAGCRTDAACESDPATLHIRASGKYQESKFHVQPQMRIAICERELLKRAVMVQFIINNI